MSKVTARRHAPEYTEIIQILFSDTAMGAGRLMAITPKPTAIKGVKNTVPRPPNSPVVQMSSSHNTMVLKTAKHGNNNKQASVREMFNMESLWRANTKGWIIPQRLLSGALFE